MVVFVVAAMELSRVEERPSGLQNELGRGWFTCNVAAASSVIYLSGQLSTVRGTQFSLSDQGDLESLG